MGETFDSSAVGGGIPLLFPIAHDRVQIVIIVVADRRVVGGFGVDELGRVRLMYFRDGLWVRGSEMPNPRAFLYAWITWLRTLNQQPPNLRRLALMALRANRRLRLGWYQSHLGGLLEVVAVDPNGDVVAEDGYGSYLTTVQAMLRTCRYLGKKRPEEEIPF